MRINRYIRNIISDFRGGIDHRMKRSKDENIQEARLYTDKALTSIRKGMKMVGREAAETEEMARSFFRLLEHKLNLNERDDPPTKEEVKKAIEQLKDVGKFSFFATMVILPGGVISLVGLELLARKFGIKDFTLIPSSFRKKHSQNTDSTEIVLPENMDTLNKEDLKEPSKDKDKA